jgi:hypothetical protein
MRMKKYLLFNLCAIYIFVLSLNNSIYFVSCDSCDSVYGPHRIITTETVVGVTDVVGFVDIVYNFTNVIIGNNTNVTVTPSIDWALVPIPWCFENIYPIGECTLLYYGETVSSNCTAGGITSDLGPPDEYIGYFLAVFNSDNPACNGSFQRIMNLRVSNVFNQVLSPSTFDTTQKIDSNVNKSSVAAILADNSAGCNDCSRLWLECREPNGITIQNRPLNVLTYEPSYLYSALCYDASSVSYLWKLENLENTFGVYYSASFYEGAQLISQVSGRLE